MASSKERWDVVNKSPKAYVSFMSQELNEYQNVRQNQTNLEAMANVWEPEKQWTQTKVEHAHKA